MRALVVGAGLMGRWHADAIRRAGGAVAAIVDANVPRAIQLARSIGGGCAPVGTLDDAFARHHPDVVHVCTPAGTHEALVERALAAGCHAIIEKPMTGSLAEAERLFGLAGEQGKLLCPVHQFLFQPGALRVAALARDGALGDLLHIDATACSSGAAGKGEAESDEIALDIAPHALALLARLAPDALDAMRWAVARPRPGELRVLGDGGGLTAAITVSMAARPTRNGATVLGSEASAELDFFHGFATVFRARSDRRWKIVRPFVVGGRTLVAAGTNLAARARRGESAYPGLRELVRRFYAAAAENRPAPISVRETLAVARARDRIAGAMHPAVAAPAGRDERALV